MKMAGRRRLAVLFTLLGVFLIGAGAQQTEQRVRISVGSDIIMKPNYTGNPSEINWKIDGNKLVDMDLIPPKEPHFYRLRDRASINRTNGVLTIRNLTIDDSALYRAEALVNDDYQITEIKLIVREEPDVPEKSTNIALIFFIVVFILVLVVILGVIAWLYHHRERNPTDVEGRLLLTQSEQVAMVGSEVTLEPQYTGNPSQIYWNINGDKLVYMKLNSQEEPRFDHLHDRASIDRTNGRLTIKDLTTEDSAVYKVAVLVNDDYFHSTEIKLTVQGNPTDLEGRPSLTQSLHIKMVGSDVTLEPQYTGNPSEITWKINGEGLVCMKLNSPDEPRFYHLQDRATIDRTNGRLTIKDLTTEDSGVYRAAALVNNGYQNTEIILTVRDLPKPTYIYRSKSCPYGGHKITKVTSDDKRKCTVRSEDQKLEQEYILGV